MGLMCDLELDFAALSQKLAIDFRKHFAAELESLADLEADGLVRVSPTGVEVTNTGRLLIRNIAMRFDSSLPSLTERRFSKTI